MGQSRLFKRLENVSKRVKIISVLVVAAVGFSTWYVNVGLPRPILASELYATETRLSAETQNVKVTAISHITQVERKLGAEIYETMRVAGDAYGQSLATAKRADQSSLAELRERIWRLRQANKRVPQFMLDHEIRLKGAVGEFERKQQEHIQWRKRRRR